jgi:flagellar biosynthesis/type III secretory pathway chaperone
MTPNDLADAARLDSEIASFRALRDVLRAEQDTLRRVDPDALADLVPRKLAALSVVDRLTRERGNALRDLPVAGDASLVARWLGGQPADAATEARVRELIELAQETFTLNAANHRVAQAQSRYFERAADALRRAAGQDVVYGADGRTAPHSASRTLVSGV